MYLITAHDKFQILKNGSDYQGAWPPLKYNNTQDRNSHLDYVFNSLC